MMYSDRFGPVAYCGFRHWHTDRAFLNRAGVVRQYRGLGLQLRMIRLRERRARAEGYVRLLTYTVAGNVPSANNLIKAGYRQWVPSGGAEEGVDHWYRDL